MRLIAIARPHCSGSPHPTAHFLQSHAFCLFPRPLALSLGLLPQLLCRRTHHGTTQLNSSPHPSQLPCGILTSNYRPLLLYTPGTGTTTTTTTATASSIVAKITATATTATCITGSGSAPPTEPTETGSIRHSCPSEVWCRPANGFYIGRKRYIYLPAVGWNSKWDLDGEVTVSAVPDKDRPRV